MRINISVTGINVTAHDADGNEVLRLEQSDYTLALDLNKGLAAVRAFTKQLVEDEAGPEDVTIKFDADRFGEELREGLEKAAATVFGEDEP